MVLPPAAGWQVSALLPAKEQARVAMLEPDFYPCTISAEDDALLQSAIKVSAGGGGQHDLQQTSPSQAG